MPCCVKLYHAGREGTHVQHSTAYLNKITLLCSATKCRGVGVCRHLLERMGMEVAVGKCLNSAGKTENLMQMMMMVSTITPTH